MGAFVKCPWCKGVYHACREGFKRERLATGADFELLPRYRKWRWASFAESEHVKFANLVCPKCGGQYCDNSGRVRELVNSLGRPYKPGFKKNPGNEGAHERIVAYRRDNPDAPWKKVFREIPHAYLTLKSMQANHASWKKQQAQKAEQETEAA